MRENTVSFFFPGPVGAERDKLGASTGPTYYTHAIQHDYMRRSTRCDKMISCKFYSLVYLFRIRSAVCVIINWLLHWYPKRCMQIFSDTSFIRRPLWGSYIYELEEAKIYYIICNCKVGKGHENDLASLF